MEIACRQLSVTTTQRHSAGAREELSKENETVNPKYSFAEWFVVPAISKAAAGNYSLVRELQEVIDPAIAEQIASIEKKYYRLKPLELLRSWRSVLLQAARHDRKKQHF